MVIKMKQNLFIVGNVAAGKNELLERLKNKYNLTIIDSGKLYRYLTLVLSGQETISPDYTELYQGNILEKERINQAIFKLNKTLTDILKNLKLNENGKLIAGETEINDELLYSKNVNALISVVASNSLIRKQILSLINNNLLSISGNFAMTGHNLNEMDTTKFTTIFLDVSDEVASERLYRRNPDSYNGILDAYKEVRERNSIDKMDLTKNLIKDLYNGIYVDTTDLTPFEVEGLVADEIERIEREGGGFKKVQDDKSIPRE